VEQILVVNSPAVVGEVIDGEAIILCVETGHYYSSRGLGAFVWSLIMEGRAIDQIIDAATVRYDASPEFIGDKFRAFVVELERERLVRYEASPLLLPEEAAFAQNPEQPREPFEAPVLCAYTDMKDLILLDPIHDVDEMGWPAAPRGIKAQ
jgi:Coenzyme PQQ synthesis protein D (PqqD)